MSSNISFLCIARCFDTFSCCLLSCFCRFYIYCYYCRRNIDSQLPWGITFNTEVNCYILKLKKLCEQWTVKNFETKNGRLHRSTAEQSCGCATFWPMDHKYAAECELKWAIIHTSNFLTMNDKRETDLVQLSWLRIRLLKLIHSVKMVQIVQSKSWSICIWKP